MKKQKVKVIYDIIINFIPVILTEKKREKIIQKAIPKIAKKYGWE